MATNSAVASELSAMRKIVGILDKLEEGARMRVVVWTFSQYSGEQGTGDVEQGTGDVEQDAGKSTGGEPVADDNQAAVDSALPVREPVEFLVPLHDQ